MQRWFWRPCVPQVVFIGRWWPCRCPNIIIAIVVCRAEQTLKPLCAPPPPAAATDSTLHENMQIRIKTENISIKLHTSGWCFWGDSYWKKMLTLIRVQTGCLVFALSSTHQYHTWEMLQLRLVGFCSVGQKGKKKKVASFQLSLLNYSIESTALAWL